MNLPLIGNIEESPAECDQQNLGNDDARTEDTKQKHQEAIYNPEIHT